jgi:hypothetical protein
MSKIKIVFSAIGGIIVVIIITFALELGGLKWRMFFGPKHAAIEREVFKETRSYNEAKLQDLTRYRLQYLRAETEVEKNAIASTIRHQFAEYDENKLPLELAEFVKESKYGNYRSYYEKVCIIGINGCNGIRMS